MHNVDLTPIKTVHNGYLFKSKLEAKWAVFFDALGFDYEYEPEAFRVGGGWYTPDFYVPKMYLWKPEYEGVYIEIKPIGWEATAEYYQKIQVAMRRKNLVILCGEPYDFAIPHWESNSAGYCASPEPDKHQRISYCYECDLLGIEYLGDHQRCCQYCDATRNGAEMMSAAIHARQKRFFHK